MSQNLDADGRDRLRIVAEASSSDGSPGDTWDISEAAGRPRLRVRTVERTTIVRFVDAEILFEEATVKMLGDQLARLIEVAGYTRVLLNFSGVPYLSGAMLGRLACLQKNLIPARGRIQLCGRIRPSSPRRRNGVDHPAADPMQEDGWIDGQKQWRHHVCDFHRRSIRFRFGE